MTDIEQISVSDDETFVNILTEKGKTKKKKRYVSPVATVVAPIRTVPYIRVLTIDPGKINPAYSVFDYLPETETLQFVGLGKDNWSTKFDARIAKLLDTYTPHRVYVEQQPRFATMSVRKLGMFIHGFCYARGIWFAQCKPYCQGKHIQEYKNRKSRSILDFQDAIKKHNIKFNTEPYRDKLDDIADAFNMGFRNIVETAEGY